MLPGAGFSPYTVEKLLAGGEQLDSVVSDRPGLYQTVRSQHSKFVSQALVLSFGVWYLFTYFF